MSQLFYYNLRLDKHLHLLNICYDGIYMYQS